MNQTNETTAPMPNYVPAKLVNADSIPHVKDCPPSPPKKNPMCSHWATRAGTKTTHSLDHTQATQVYDQQKIIGRRIPTTDRSNEKNTAAFRIWKNHFYIPREVGRPE
eukprot:c18229_g1_i4.p2 GENE.c18229_g1_i4~~c18229_g1_i4.p2  ORF type:complete len:108 (-),score=9.20 c18229_g1_i4:612-935(-)